MKQRSNIAIIVAIGKDMAIGKDGKMIWHLPEDLKFFKRTTSGHTILMGRKTWESLPNGALPDRRNIVISRREEFIPVGAEKASSIEDAINMVDPSELIFIIGGGDIYRQSVAMADTLFLTRIEAESKDADTHFPKIDLSEWVLITSSEEYATKDGVRFHFETWKRR